MVVIIHPDFNLISYLVNVFKQINVEYSFSESAIKTFNEFVLYGLSRLNVWNGDVVSLAYPSFASTETAIIMCNWDRPTASLMEIKDLLRSLTLGRRIGDISVSLDKR